MLVSYEMMASYRRIILVWLVLVTIVVSSLVKITEASRYHSENGNKSPRHRHRHRHDAAAVASSRRNHELSSVRRSPWPQQDDEYEDTFDVEEDDVEEDEEDYEVERTRTLHERNYPPARNIQRKHHSRFEPRYPLRYHQNGHHANPWYHGGIDDDVDRRRNSRYGGSPMGSGIGGGRGHRLRPGRDRTYHHDDQRRDGVSAGGYTSRIHEFVDPEEDFEDEVALEHNSGYDRPGVRRWRLEEEQLDDNPQDYRGGGGAALSKWRNSRRYRPSEPYDTTLDAKDHRGRQDPRRNDWKSRPSTSIAKSSVSSVFSVQRNEDEDWAERRRKMGSGSHRGSKRPKRPSIDDLDDIYNVDKDKNENKGNKETKFNLTDQRSNGDSDHKKENDLDDRDYEDTLDSNSGERKRGSKFKVDKKEEEEEDDDEDDDKEQEEENIWKEADDNNDDDDDAVDEDDAFDNTNYYKTEDEPPYKTFDDIIKSLTSDDPTTPKPTVRRDYRNTGIEKYLKRDAYGNMYDSRNSTAMTSYRITNWTNVANKWRFHASKPDITNYSNNRDSKKISNAIGDGLNWKANKDHDKKRIQSKLDESMTKTRSLEQEYDEDYDNNEKDEDVKVGGENVTEMQADINNTEYADEENETETEDETSAPLATFAPTTTTMSPITTRATTKATTTAATTTTTTTTSRPVVTIAPGRVTHERRDARSYETSNGPQSNGLQQHPSQSSHKWQSLTTRDGSKDSKGHDQQNNKNGKSAEIKEALQHAIKVSREGSCQWPRARVIPVRDVYPSPSTTYIPHCAILHRCSDDTGCCRSEALTCVPKISHRVELYFYTTSVGRASVVEKLSFYNHTECECKERNEFGTSGDKTGGTNEHRFYRHHPPAVSPPQNIRRPPQRKPCRCPSEFTPRITPEGQCQCNCFENDQDCIRSRRGKGYFSLRDRLCIQNEECATPSCEFGEYMRRQGKCPRKKDKFDAIANYPTNMNLHHRFRS